MSEQTPKHLTTEELLKIRTAAATALDTYGRTGAFEGGADPTQQLAAAPNLHLVEPQPVEATPLVTHQDAS